MIMTSLGKYFELSHLKRVSARVRLEKGENVEDVTDIFIPSELQAMKERSEIRILPTNPRRHKVNDDV